MLQKLEPELYPKKLKLLTESRPKYIWIASCYISDLRVLDFTFDATGVNQAMLGLNVVSYLEDSLNEHIVNSMNENKTDDALNMFKSFSCEQYYNFLLNELR